MKEIALLLAFLYGTSEELPQESPITWALVKQIYIENELLFDGEEWTNFHSEVRHLQSRLSSCRDAPRCIESWRLPPMAWVEVALSQTKRELEEWESLLLTLPPSRQDPYFQKIGQLKKSLELFQAMWSVLSEKGNTYSKRLWLKKVKILSGTTWEDLTWHEHL